MMEAEETLEMEWEATKEQPQLKTGKHRRRSMMTASLPKRVCICTSLPHLVSNVERWQNLARAAVEVAVATIRRMFFQVSVQMCRDRFVGEGHRISCVRG